MAASTSGVMAQLNESRSSALQLSGSTAAALSAAQARVASAKATLAREQAQLAQDSADAGRAAALMRAGAVSPSDRRAREHDLSRAAIHRRRRGAKEVGAAEADLANAQSGTHAVAAAQGAVANDAQRGCAVRVPIRWPR